MEVDEKFAQLAGVVGESARAKMLWNLLDGRAYTASELALAADISPTAASNHLARLLEARIVRVDIQGRHRYFSFSRPEVAHAIEAMASLIDMGAGNPLKKPSEKTGIKFCRTCYDHLAGYVGVSLAEGLEYNGLIEKMSDNEYSVTAPGWDWLRPFDIREADLFTSRRPVARQCLDWSERRPHVAGQLGALLLKAMLGRDWLRKKTGSREVILTAKGRKELYDGLRLQF